MPYSHEKFPVLFARNVRHEERGHAFANSASGARECFGRGGRLRCDCKVGLGNGVVLIPCAGLCPLVGEYRDVAVAVAVEILDASPITRMVQVFGYVTYRDCSFWIFFFMALTRSRRGVTFAKTKAPQSTCLI